MITITVNTPDGEYEYKLTHVSFGEAVAAAKTLHPTWTSMVATLTNHRLVEKEGK